MRRFGTQGPVNSKDNYVVARSEELADFINVFPPRTGAIYCTLCTAADSDFLVSAVKPRFSKMPSGCSQENRQVVLIIDEFDGIPQGALNGFLRSLRRIYLTGVADYFPIQLNFEKYEDITPTDFYGSVCKEICKEIQRGFRERVDASISTTILSASLQLMVSSEQMKMECVRSSTPSIYIEFCRHSSHL